MNLIKKRLVFGAFLLASLFNLLAEYTGNQSLTFYTKPLLMPLLLWWLLLHTPSDSSRLRKAFVVGLIFSTFGDVLLMLRRGGDANATTYFLAGVGAFLVAQIAYTIGFLSKINLSNSLFWRQPLWLLPILAYLISMLWWLPGLRVFPLWLYAVAITTMLASAVNMQGWVPSRAWQSAVLGAIFFVTSDSLLACGLFGVQMVHSGVLVMLTYIIGQYFLVNGVREMNS